MTDWPIDRFRRLPITEVIDADLQAAADTLDGWAKQIECGNNFIHASGQAAALNEYKEDRNRALAELRRRAHTDTEGLNG